MVAEDIDDPLVVRQDYTTEDRFLARRLSAWAELDGHLAAVDLRPRAILRAFVSGSGDERTQ